jgi:hypothetical protein
MVSEQLIARGPRLNHLTPTGNVESIRLLAASR